MVRRFFLALLLAFLPLPADAQNFSQSPSGGGPSGIGGVPSAGQVPFGNAGGTNYAPQTPSGDISACTSGGNCQVKTTTANVAANAWVSEAHTPVSGTSVSATAPSSIVVGNALLAAIKVDGVTTETWTPPAGFAQLGSTVTSVASSKVVAAVFCKVAVAGDVGAANYSFSFNNSVGNGEISISQLAGPNCTLDAAGVKSATGNASSVTISSFALTSANDTLLMVSAVTAGTFSLFQNPVGTIDSGAFNNLTANGLLAGVMAFGGGTVPSILANHNGTTNDMVVLAVPLISASTATSAIVNNGGPANVQSLNVADGAHFGNAIDGQSFIMPNGGTVTAASCYSSGGGGALCTKLVNGTTEPWVGLNSANNLQIDPLELFGYTTIGSGTPGPSRLLVQPAGGIWTISNDVTGLQDVPVFQQDTSYNMLLGCATAGPSLGTSSCGGSSNNNNDWYILLQSGKKFHLWINTGDVFTVDGSAVKLLAGETLSMAEGAAPSGAAATDILYADSTAHNFKVNNNNGGATNVVTDTTAAAILTATQSATPQNSVGCADTSVTVSGAATTEGCIASPAGTLAAADANTVASCYVSAANTVQLHLCTLAVITGASQSYNIKVVP